MGHSGTRVLRARGCRTGNLVADVAAAAGAVEGQARHADRPCESGAAIGLARALLRLRRTPVFLLRRRAGRNYRAPPPRLHAARRVLPRAFFLNPPTPRWRDRRT